MQYRSSTASAALISHHLHQCGDDFISKLSNRVDIAAYAAKLHEKAFLQEAWDGDTLVGLVAYYKNEQQYAYITNVSVDVRYARQGIATKLLHLVIAELKKDKLRQLLLEVDHNNQPAQRLYEKMGFAVDGQKGEVLCMALSIPYFHWHKLGHLFDPTTVKNRSYLKHYAQAPATLVADDFIRVYFSCRPPQDENGQFVSYSTYLDLDRKDLFHIRHIAEMPILPLGEKGCFDEFGTYPVSVLPVDDEVWAYYAGWTRCHSVPFNCSIGMAKSRDGGKTFEKLGPGPVLSFSPDEPTVISGPKIRRFNNMFYLFYIAASQWVIVGDRPEFSSKIRMAFSCDGINWIKANKNLIPNKLHDNESQASPDVIYQNGKYHMFFCYWNPHSFRNTKHRRIGYAYSTDLMNWIRDDARVGIDVSEDCKAFDHEMIAYPHIFCIDNKIYLLYLGNNVGQHGFGLAKLEGVLL